MLKFDADYIFTNQVKYTMLKSTKYELLNFLNLKKKQNNFMFFKQLVRIKNIYIFTLLFAVSWIIIRKIVYT